MRRLELQIEHHYKSRYVGKHRVRKESDSTVLGSSRDADIRLLGEGVNGVHALIEFIEGVWTISDLGSEEGTWVKKKPIISQEIKGITQVRIGGHDIRITPKAIESDIFSPSKPLTTNQKGDRFHQIILKKRGFVFHTELLKSHETYMYKHGNKVHNLTPPKNEEWMSHEFGDVVIQQRLAYGDHLEESTQERVKFLINSDMKVPLVSALVLFVMVFGLILMAPNKPDDELIAVKPEKNRYTKMIYDAKVVRKKRKRALALRKKMNSKPSGAMHSPAKSVKKMAKASKGKTPKVVSRIKASGLSQLLGKISKRAAKQATFVSGQGKTPDHRGLGRSLASLGGVSGVAGKKAGGSGKTYKVGGVGTIGKGGTSLKGIGSLKGGSVGNASVGILDEETEIQGGLDRDVIARVIQSKLGQIRYCYERQLSASPDLYGKVMIKFTIGGKGSVVTQNVGLTTLNSAMVEGCILRRVASWKFPQPKGGTSVLVSYPFLFKSSN